MFLSVKTEWLLGWFLAQSLLSSLCISFYLFCLRFPLESSAECSSGWHNLLCAVTQSYPILHDNKYHRTLVYQTVTSPNLCTIWLLYSILWNLMLDRYPSTFRLTCQGLQIWRFILPFGFSRNWIWPLKFPTDHNNFAFQLWKIEVNNSFCHSKLHVIFLDWKWIDIWLIHSWNSISHLGTFIRMRFLLFNILFEVELDQGYHSVFLF